MCSFFCKYECVIWMWPIWARATTTFSRLFNLLPPCYSPNSVWMACNLLCSHWSLGSCLEVLTLCLIRGKGSPKVMFSTDTDSLSAVFAARSAFSLPGMPMWLGTKANTTYLFSVSRFKWSTNISVTMEWLKSRLWIVSRTDKQS